MLDGGVYIVGASYHSITMVGLLGGFATLWALSIILQEFPSFQKDTSSVSQTERDEK